MEHNVSQLDDIRPASVGVNSMDGPQQTRLHDEVLALHRVLRDPLASRTIRIQYGSERRRIADGSKRRKDV